MANKQNSLTVTSKESEYVQLTTTRTVHVHTFVSLLSFELNGVRRAKTEYNNGPIRG